MARYEMPNKYGNLTPAQVRIDTGHLNGTLDQNDTLDALNTYFKSPYYPIETNAALSQQNVKIITNNDDPAYMFLANYNSMTAHATALVGYRETGNNINIWLMDPAVGRTTLYPVYDDGITYTNNTREYQWIDTFILSYR